MKRSIIYSFLAVLIILAGCRKDDNPKIPDLARVPTPLITKDATTDAGITVANAAAFRSKVVVDLYFKTDKPPQKFDLVIMKNTNKAKVMTLKDNITTYPTTVEITGPQLVTLFGEPVKAGDRFDVGADVTTENGQLFQAFPLVGNGYGAGVANQVGASTSVRYDAK